MIFDTLVLLSAIILIATAEVLPSPSQLTWADYEVGVIIHFGMTTFNVDKDAQVILILNIRVFAILK